MKASYLVPLVILFSSPVFGQDRSVKSQLNELNKELWSVSHWGTNDSILLRETKRHSLSYSENFGTGINPRFISNRICTQEDSLQNKEGKSHWIWLWAQFISHDIALTESNEKESLTISIPFGDPTFRPGAYLYFNRSKSSSDLLPVFDQNITEETTSDLLPSEREQINSTTSYIDGSMIYGSTYEIEEFLRTQDGSGKLKLAENGLPTESDEKSVRLEITNPHRVEFITGDIRANETAYILALYTLFVREHNRLAEKIKSQQPHWSGDKIYTEARKIVRAELQAITYNEFLPAVLGIDALREYDGYDESISPGVSNFFYTVAFRFYHSAIGDDLDLPKYFFNHSVVAENGIDAPLQHISQHRASEVDPFVVDSIRDFDFDNGRSGMDLAAINIQRARDHELPTYRAAREQYGLPSVETFSEITKDERVSNAMRRTYQDITKVDPWVGGLAEDHVPGAMVGELFYTVIAKQFERLRDADPHFYKSDLRKKSRKWVDRQTLSKIIMRNSELQVQADVFTAPKTEDQ